MTSAPDGGRPDVDAIVARLREAVQRRLSAGEYPEGLLEDLDQHYRAVLGRRTERSVREVQEQMRALAAAGRFGRDRIYMDSRLPLGSQLHRVAGMAVTRQTDGLLNQMQDFANALRAVLESIVHLLPFDDVTDLSARVDGILDRLAGYERTGAHADPVVRELSRRVELLEAEARSRDFRPWYSQEAFEQAFRGSREALLTAYASLADRFHGCAPVVDMGCGRGEMLELLRDRGIAARGVEIDGELVAHCRAMGLDVIEVDGIAYLESQPDGGLGGIYLGQVIEHLTAQQASDLMAIASSKLREGGRLIIETVNPQSLYVFARAFYLDPTHVRPVHPAYLEFLARQAGFEGVAIDWRSPVPEDERLQLLPPASENGASPAHEVRAAVDSDIDRLNRLIFAPQDYALIATR